LAEIGLLRNRLLQLSEFKVFVEFAEFFPIRRGNFKIRQIQRYRHIGVEGDKFAAQKGLVFKIFKVFALLFFGDGVKLFI